MIWSFHLFFEDDNDIAYRMIGFPSILSHFCPVHVFGWAKRPLVDDIFVSDINEFRIVLLADEDGDDSAPAFEV